MLVERSLNLCSVRGKRSIPKFVLTFSYGDTGQKGCAAVRWRKQTSAARYVIWVAPDQFFADLTFRFEDILDAYMPPGVDIVAPCQYLGARAPRTPLQDHAPEGGRQDAGRKSHHKTVRHHFW